MLDSNVWQMQAHYMKTVQSTAVLDKIRVKQNMDRIEDVNENRKSYGSLFIEYANNKVAAESIVSPWDDPVMGTRS